MPFVPNLSHKPVESLLILYISTNDTFFFIASHHMEKTPLRNDTLKNFRDYERVEEEKPSQNPVQEKLHAQLQWGEQHSW